jgi:hypothetical protein
MYFFYVLCCLVDFEICVYSRSFYFLPFQHVTYGSAGGSSNNISDSERNFFVELWDVSGHERYKECRSIFYSQINGTCCVTSLLMSFSWTFIPQKVVFGNFSV